MAKYIPKYGKPAPKRRHGQKLMTKILLILALLSAALTAVTGDVAAKYARRTSGEAVAKVKEFYFTSDYLMEEHKKYTLNEGVNDFSFEIRNFDGLNVSELDIRYTVEVTSSGEDTVIPSIKKGTLTGGTQDADTVQLENLIPGNTYTIRVTGKNGYELTLSAEVTPRMDNCGFYKNTKIYQDYVILTVWTKNTAGTATITVPAGLIPDATDDVMMAEKSGDSISVTLNEYQSRTYRFFIGSGYGNGNITVTYGGVALLETAVN